MPFVPFHSGSTTVAKAGKVAPAAPSANPFAGKVAGPKVVPPAKAAKQAKNAMRIAKPSGAGPRGSAGYFDNC